MLTADEIRQALALLGERKWIPMAVLVVYALVRLLREDARFLPDISGPNRAVAAMVLGVVAGFLERISSGTSARDALITGLGIGATAIAMHFVGVEVVRGGEELPIPAFARKRPPNTPPSPPPMALLALLVVVASCRATPAQVDAGVGAVTAGCELIDAIATDGSYRSICATIPEIADIIQRISARRGDAGAAALGPCRPLAAEGRSVCATPHELAEEIARINAERERAFVR